MQYHLRDIPDDLWVRVKQRCHDEGRSIRFVIVTLLEQFADHGVRPNIAARDAKRFSNLINSLSRAGIVVGESHDGNFVIQKSRPRSTSRL
jgi:hypothetical protein